MNEFNLGDTLRDNISGFEGIAVGRHTFMSGTIQYQIAPRKVDDKGLPAEHAILDWQQLFRTIESAPIEPPAVLPVFFIGDQVEDSITDLSGTVTSISEYINGCVRYGVQPRTLNRDGDIVKPRLMDSQSLVLKSKGSSQPAPRIGGPERMPA